MLINDPCLEFHTVDILSIRAGESLDAKRDCQSKRRRELLERCPHATIRELDSAHLADKDVSSPWTSLGMVWPFQQHQE